MKKLLLLTLFAPAVLSAQVPSSPSLGIAEGTCRPGERGPSLLINIVGIRDRKGTLKAELYPGNDEDLLQDDNILINAGKTFRRVVVDVPDSGPIQLCIRAPAAGTYGLVVLHDRNRDRHFDKSYDGDGLGFGRNPSSMGPFKPRMSAAGVTVGAGPTPISIRLLYRQSLFSISPLKGN